MLPPRWRIHAVQDQARLVLRRRIRTRRQGTERFRKFRNARLAVTDEVRLLAMRLWPVVCAEYGLHRTDAPHGPEFRIHDDDGRMLPKAWRLKCGKSQSSGRLRASSPRRRSGQDPEAVLAVPNDRNSIYVLRTHDTHVAAEMLTARTS